MLVRLNENRLVVAHIVPRHDPKDLVGKTEEEIQRMIGAQGMVTIYPQVNDIPDDKWAAIEPDLDLILKSKVQHNVEKKGHKVLEIIEVKVGSALISDFFRIPPPTAAKLIKETVSHETLQYWEKKETRESVRVALARRMDELDIERAKDDDDDMMDEDEVETTPRVPAKSNVKKVGV